jgi:hypothetical protein
LAEHSSAYKAGASKQATNDELWAVMLQSCYKQIVWVC